MTTFAMLFLFCLAVASLIGATLARLTLRWMVQRDYDQFRDWYRWME